MNEIDFLNEVKGLDEDGKSKAQVVVGIMDVLKNEMICSCIASKPYRMSHTPIGFKKLP